MTPRFKAATKTDRTRLRHEMTALGCPAAEIATEMRTRFGLRPREAWRHAHGWTLQETADHVNAVGCGRGEAVAADASLVGKWEKWPGPSGRRPALAVLAALAQTFTCSLDQLLDLEDRRAMPETDRRILATRGTAPSAATTPVAAPAAPAEPQGADLIRVAAQESADWAAWAETANIGDTGIEQLMADVRALAEDYLTAHPHLVFARARTHRNRVFALLRGRQHLRHTRDLHLAAGYLCTLLSWMSGDLGHLREAETQARTAWLCAERAGNPQLRAWVLSTRSKNAFWAGRLREAAALASQGTACHPTGSVSILLPCQEADAYAQAGARTEAHAALATAATAQEALNGQADEIGGLLACDDFRRVNYHAGVCLRTGQAATARDEAQQALRTHQSPAYGTTAQLHISQATAHLALGAPDGAAEALRPVLALPPEQRLKTVVHRVRDFSQTLRGSRFAPTAPALALRGEIETWCAEAASARPALSPGTTTGCQDPGP